MGTRKVKRAFTLIEILIVVVILGILAAIVIPQFTDASEDAMNANVRSQLQTIRSQIELFNVQAPSNGWEPYSGTMTRALGVFWDDLVNNDYLQQNPRNPLQDTATADVVLGAAGAGGGWIYDATGDFRATDGAGAEFNEIGP